MGDDYMRRRFLERVWKTGTATGWVTSVERVAVVFEHFGVTIALPMSGWYGRGFLPAGYGVRLQLPMHGDWVCEDVEVDGAFGEVHVYRDCWGEEPGTSAAGYLRLPERLTLAAAVARGLEVTPPRRGHFRFKERKPK